MQVHGFKQLAKDFAREVEENDGKVIYVNLTEAGKDWNSSIHYHGTSAEREFQSMERLVPATFHPSILQFKAIRTAS